MQSAFFICAFSLFLPPSPFLPLWPIGSEDTVWGKTYSRLPGVLPWLRKGDPWPSPSYMTWLTAFHLSRFSARRDVVRALSLFPSSLFGDDPCFFVSLCTIEMSGVFLLSSRMLKLGCDAASHVCFGRITCLLLWDGLLITHTLPQHMPLMQLLSMSVCESVVRVSGHTINNVAHICDISACKCLWLFY